MNRRDLIKKLAFGAASILAMPEMLKPAHANTLYPCDTAQIVTPEALDSVVAADCQKRGWERSPKERESIFNAYSRIQPRTHTELALVVWATMSCYDPKRQELLEEYCLRKAGKEPQIFVHPVLQNCTLETDRTFGLPIFKEQIEIIGRVVLGLNVAKLYQKFHEGEDLSANIELVRYKNPAVAGLTDSEIVQCLELLVQNYATSIPHYSYCSAVVEQSGL